MNNINTPIKRNSGLQAAEFHLVLGACDLVLALLVPGACDLVLDPILFRI